MEFGSKIHGGIILPKEAEPSGLSRHLDALKDPATGHIMVTPSQARELLLDRLVLEHRRMAEKGPHPDIDLPPGFWSDPLVEALDIARKTQGQETIDLTQVLETFMEERNAGYSEHRKRTDHLSSIPPDPEEYDDLP